jgi:hypothetical protein
MEYLTKLNSMDNFKLSGSAIPIMSRAFSKARKVGGSLMVTIPKELVELEDIHEGEMVEFEVKKARRAWFGIDPEMGPMTRGDELDAHP